ncbi:hypothetical protein BsWGS_26833 [Bradybaena similaris]
MTASIVHKVSSCPIKIHQPSYQRIILHFKNADSCNYTEDMTSRDLLQQRSTLPNGDTVWGPSPLVTAALEGSLAVLDGVHRVNSGSFSVFHSSSPWLPSCPLASC